MAFRNSLYPCRLLQIIEVKEPTRVPVTYQPAGPIHGHDPFVFPAPAGQMGHSLLCRGSGALGLDPEPMVCRLLVSKSPLGHFGRRVDMGFHVATPVP